MTAIAMVAVASLAGCSANADLDTNTTDSNKQESVATPVNFGSYLAQSKSTLSRAGGTTSGSETTSASSASSASEMTTAELQKTGFGVVAYYTTTSYSAGQSTTEPNFMYNTRVSGASWTYSPVMYWPNGGQTEGATPGENTQYLSFFAYAPYKETFGDKGITALSSNSIPGDPTVSYTLGANGADADLLWGTAGTNGTTTTGNAQNGTDFRGGAKAAVNANLSKMKVGGKVTFNFKHALAKFGGTGAGTDNKTSGLMVVADIDNATTGGTLDGNTKITVKSIKIESVKAGADGKTMTTDASIPTSGTLNLATGVWTTNNNGKIDYEINSPKAAATEGATTQTMKTTIAEPASVADGETGWNSLPAGVTTTAQSVYTESTPLLLIPDGKDHTLRISIDYIVRTKNASLHKGYTEVEQSFYKDLTLMSVSYNAKYNLLIHLGLTSVKFEATVSDWTNTIAGGTTSGTASDPATATDPATAPDPIVIYMPANVANN